MERSFPWRRIALFLFCLFFFYPSEGFLAAQVLRVGVSDLPGFYSVDKAGYTSGYGYEYMQEMAEYENWDLVFVPDTWENCLANLQSGKISLLVGKIWDSRQLEEMDFSRLPMGWTYMRLSLRDGQSGIEIFANQHRSFRIGYLENEYISSSLAGAARENGFTYDTKSYLDFDDMHKQYVEGQIDGYMADMVYRTNDPVTAMFDVQPIYIVTKKGNRELMAQVNRAMDRMLLDDPLQQARLFEKYYMNGEAQPLTLNPEERAYLAKKKKLIAVDSPGEKPYTYFENGVHKGIVEEIIQRMAKDLQIEIETKEVKSNAEAFALIKSGQADIMTDFYSDYNWAGKQGVKISTPFMKMNYVAVVRRRGKVPEKPKVACIKDYFYTHAFVEKQYPSEQCLYYRTADECLQAVSRGEADITYMKAVMAQYNIWKGRYHDLMTSGDIVFSHDISIAVNAQADPILLGIFNKEIKHMEPQSIQAIINREFFNTQEDRSFVSLLYSYPLQFFVASVAIGAVVIGFLLYLMRLRRRHTQNIRRIAYSDRNTGLPNVRWFEKEVAELLPYYPLQRDQGRLAVVILGLVRIDILVENYGRQFLAEQFRRMVHEMQATRKWMQRIAVSSDAGQILCFCCVPEGESLEKLVQDTLRDYGKIYSEGAYIHIDIKAGICIVPAAGGVVDQMVSCADTACNELNGKAAQIQFFNEGLQKRIALQQDIERYMEKALQKKEFQVWYQPKYDLRTYRCIGAEALVRWQSPEMGFLMPGKFIDIFEWNGFIIPLDFYILDTVFRVQQERIAAGLAYVPISVNQSRLHMQQEDYLEEMGKIAKQYHLPPNAIELELTETAFADFTDQKEREHALSVVGKLQDMGFAISMDDFGSGYSSLTLLNDLPMDVMKIDRSLLVAAEGTIRSQMILASSISLGNQLEMEVICEGIETKEQEDLLMQYGCFRGQGFYYAKPMPRKAFREFLANHSS